MIQSRHHIGFKERQNQSFKAGGPIRATGAIYDRINRDNNSFNSTYNREINTPANGIQSSKMPQRPGSSKPVQKGSSMLDNDER